MKKSIFTMFAILISLLVQAQVTTSPTFITQTGGAFTIYYNASATAGTSGLSALTTGVYAHIGVITSASTSDTDWKYVLTPWPQTTPYSNYSLANTAKNALTYNATTKLWELPISPNIQDFLGVPATETIKKIAVVFRNTSGSLTGKTLTGGDIFINVYQAGLNVSFTSPSTDGASTVGTQLPIVFASSVAADLKLSVNGTQLNTATAATTLSTSYTFSSAIDYQFIAEATASGTTVKDTLNICVPSAVVSQARPNGELPGITYNSTTSATLVLHAPLKSSVFLLGDMNNWTQSNAYQLKKDGDYWWITLTGLTPQQLYGFQYLVDGTLRVSDPYTELVLDPWSDNYISTTNFPNRKPYPTGKTTGVVATLQTGKTPFNWSVPNFTMPEKSNMIIYEMLFRDFTPEKSVSAAMAKLDYLKTLGITAVELMPITEFDGNESWGYNPSHYFATDKAYGTPEMYKTFIDECHKRGIAVILDMVFNHATGNSPFAALYWDAVNNHPASNNPWMNTVAPHQFGVFNDFNHTSTFTRDYFKRVVAYWINEYKVDGYRLDLTKGFTQNSGTESTYDQSRIDNISVYYDAAKAVKSDVMFILEHFVAAEEPTLAGKGMYPWLNFNNAYSQAAMGYTTSNDFSGLSTNPRNWIGYAESHDEERNFFKVKSYGAGNLTADSIARTARVPLNVAFLTLIPGPKMMWEFQELGYDYSLLFGGSNVSNKPSAWGLLNFAHRKSAYDACSKVVSLKRNYSNAFKNGTYALNVGTSDWSAGRRIALTHSDLNMVALGNFDATNTITAYPNFQKTGTWYEIMTGTTLNVTNTGMTLSLAPGVLRIYTDRLLTGISNPVVDTKCTVFPSVTTDNVYVSSNGIVKNITVYNLQGSTIKTIDNSTEVNLSNLSKGLYLIDVLTTEGKSIHKIIKE